MHTIHHLSLAATPEGGQQTREGGIPIPIMSARKKRARVLSAATGRIEVGRRTDLFDTYMGREPMLPQSGLSRQSRTPGYNRWISVHAQRVCPLSFTSFLDSVAMTIVERKETDRGPARRRERTKERKDNRTTAPPPPRTSVQAIFRTEWRCINQYPDAWKTFNPPTHRALSNRIAEMKSSS